MVSWTCPYCEQNMYSTYLARDQEKVRCIGCGQWFDNPYYEPADRPRPGRSTDGP